MAYHPLLNGHNYIIKAPFGYICKKCRYIADGLCESKNHNPEHNNSPIFLDSDNKLLCFVCRSNLTNKQVQPCESSYHMELKTIAPTFRCYDNQFRCYRCLFEIQNTITDIQANLNKNYHNNSEIQNYKQNMATLAKKLKITSN